MLLSVQNITKTFADDVVLQNVTLDIENTDRIGLLGVNGAGKTTLLNLITGRLEADSGTISRAKNLEIGYLRQNDALDSSNTLAQEAKDAFVKAYAVKEEMDACYKKLEADPENVSFLSELDRLTAQFESLDGYHIDDKTNRVLNGLGFGNFSRQTMVSSLSGGEKMRFAIAKMLLKEPDLLILDEPTNHLDFSMLNWLEEYLATYKGAVLVVSHDRYFLDTVARDICEIERKMLTRYKGGYSSFVTQKSERYNTAMRAYEKQQEEIAKMEEFVRKNLARSASVNGVGSRVKQLEKMDRLERPLPEPKSISLNFRYDIEPFSTVLKCENLGVYVGDEKTGRQLYDDVELEVRRGEKIALVGMNGVGKTTFLKAIQNQIAHQGKIQWGGNVRIGYFDQELAGLDMQKTVLEAVHSCYPTKTEFEIRSALGKLLLEGDAVYKKVHELSGANRAKVAFAILEMRKANVLLLDEPTNHLDYRAKEQLEIALNSFTGTLITVSHDRYFLRRVPTRILELKPNGFVQYNGNYDYYLEKKQIAEQAELTAALKEKENRLASKEATTYRSKQQRAQDAQKRTQINKLEQEIAELEASIELHQTMLADPENASNFEKLTEWSESLKSDGYTLETLMDEWLALTEED